MPPDCASRPASDQRLHNGAEVQDERHLDQLAGAAGEAVMARGHEHCAPALEGGVDVGAPPAAHLARLVGEGEEAAAKEVSVDPLDLRREIVEDTSGAYDPTIPEEGLWVATARREATCA